MYFLFFLTYGSWLQFLDCKVKPCVLQKRYNTVDMILRSSNVTGKKHLHDTNKKSVDST